MRVNLLRKSEVRYQGAVSRRFLVTTIITTSLLLLLLVSVLVCMGWQARRMRIKRLLGQMDDVRPRVVRVEELQAVVTHNTKTRTVLTQWRDNNIPWHGILRDIQLQVPESVQLTLLDISVGDAQGADTACKMNLRGTAISDQPEDVVVRFRRSLLEVGSLKSCFSSIKLVSFSRLGADQNVPLAQQQERASFGITSTGVVNQASKGP